MATRTKPLMSAVALASAAAVAVATPALAPSNTKATSPALSSAAVELATFSDLLSITGADWNNVFYNGWGGAIGSINPDPETVENDYWLPDCDYDCTIPGVSGIAYLALDALINGNGEGINDASQWSVNALNYFFEGGFATGVQYIVESPFLSNPVNQPCDAEGVTCGPLYNPAIANLIALGFQGPYALTTLYVTALSTVAQLASNVPYIGEYLYRGIGSYIGPAFQTVDSIYDYSAYAGLSGILRYVGGVITTGGNPNPYPLLQSPSAASTAAVAAKVPAALSVASAPAAETVAVESAPAATDADTKVAEPASPTATTASSTTSETKPADTASATAADAVAATPAATAPVTKPAAAPAPSRKRPVRSAAASVAKAVSSAVSRAASAATGAGSAATGAGSATGGADAAN